MLNARERALIAFNTPHIPIKRDDVLVQQCLEAFKILNERYEGETKRESKPFFRKQYSGFYTTNSNPLPLSETLDVTFYRWYMPILAKVQSFKGLIKTKYRRYKAIQTAKRAQQG